MPNAPAKLQRNQIRVCGGAVNNSIDPLTASAFVRRLGRDERPAHTMLVNRNMAAHVKPRHVNAYARRCSRQPTAVTYFGRACGPRNQSNGNRLWRVSL